MLVLRGSSSFSPARLQKRLARIGARNPGVRELTAHFVHLVDLASEPSPREQEVLVTYCATARANKRPLVSLSRVRRKASTSSHDWARFRLGPQKPPTSPSCAG